MNPWGPLGRQMPFAQPVADVHSSARPKKENYSKRLAFSTTK